MTETLWQANCGLKIEKLYAWVAQEADGGEGVVAVMISSGVVPLIGADRTRVEHYRAWAADVAAASGRPVRLKVFGAGVVIDDIAPPATAA